MTEGTTEREPVVYVAMATEPYDPDARCKKCGYDCVKTRYVPAQYPLWRQYTQNLSFMSDEYLLRTCVRCDHAWRQTVVAPVVREITKTEGGGDGEGVVVPDQQP